MDSSFFDSYFYTEIALALGLGVFYWSMRAMSKEPGDSWDVRAKSFSTVALLILVISRAELRHRRYAKERQAREEAHEKIMGRYKKKPEAEESEAPVAKKTKRTRSSHAVTASREEAEQPGEYDRTVPASQWTPPQLAAVPVAPKPAPTPVRYHCSLAHAVQVRTAYGVMTFPAQTQLTPVAQAGGNMRVRIGAQEALIPQTEIVQTAY